MMSKCLKIMAHMSENAVAASPTKLSWRRYFTILYITLTSQHASLILWAENDDCQPKIKLWALAIIYWFNLKGLLLNDQYVLF